MALSDTLPPTTPLPAPDTSSHAMTGTDMLLYAVVIFSWSTSWIALKMQLGVVAPEISLFWRFCLAVVGMWGWVALRGGHWRFPLRDHLAFAALGVLLFSGNFTLFYYGSASLPSGLLAVVFSLASVINLVLARLVFGQRISTRAGLGGLLGFGGIALMFWPQISGLSGAGVNMTSAMGLGMCAAGTVLFCCGNMVSSAAQRRGLPVVEATAWGMTYGAIFLALFSLVRGQPFIVEWTPTYLGALLFLALIASMVAFGAYLTLLGRIGPARTAYTTVVTPVFALLISTVMEGYVWTLAALCGLVLVMVGNVIVLRR